MKPIEFFGLAIFCAVMHIADPSFLYSIPAHVFALMGALASYRSFARTQGAGQ